MPHDVLPHPTCTSRGGVLLLLVLGLTAAVGTPASVRGSDPPPADAHPSDPHPSDPPPSGDAAACRAALVRAGANRGELEAALARIPDADRAHLEFLIAGMPDRDLVTLDADFLVEHVTLALEAWRSAPWHTAVPVEVFREGILPYASVDERRDRWRPTMRACALPLIDAVTTSGLAATTLNRTLFGAVGVEYSTARPKANQSPDESIEAGLASCTGLSILLIDACRAVGVPARFVGTPLWSDGSGNHSWVEVWHDGAWHFTGAAEPSGDALDRGWFIDRARRAKRDEPQHAIYATTWRRTPIHFPLVWAPEDRGTRAVNVTDRYTAHSDEGPSLPEGAVVVRFRVRDSDGVRVALMIEVLDTNGEARFSERTRDEGFDANDHVSAPLRRGARYTVRERGAASRFRHEFTVTGDEQLVDITLPGELRLTALTSLEEHLRTGGTLEEISAKEWAQHALSRTEADRARTLLVETFASRIRTSRRDEVEAESITLGEQTLRWRSRTYGRKPEAGWALWISMHGGGGTTAATNDQQWQNQVGLYDATMHEIGGSIVIAPRAPTNTWNLWHQSHIDPLFDRLITDAIFLEGVDPDRIYLIGYSAGGDGVYQLAPRMADRFAGAAMSAGHPNEARPEGLRNLPFALHMGANDSAYRRNEVARSWGEKLEALRTADPGGYPHQVELHAGKGHWMDREDAVALPWLAGFRRDLRPHRVVWVQDDVTHRRFYWLALPTGVAPKKGARLTARILGEESSHRGIVIEEAEGIERTTLRLDDAMFDLDREFVVLDAKGEILWGGRAKRTVATLARTLLERGDPRGVWSAEIVVPLGEDSEIDGR